VPAQDVPSVLTLPITGTFAANGSFSGTITINRFEVGADNTIAAVGFVSGTLTRNHRTLGTAFAGEVSWQVAVRAGGGVAGVRGRAPSDSKLRAIAWSKKTSGSPGIMRAQDPGSCPVLEIALGPNNVDLLGIDVALTGISLNLTGERGTALGDLVCAASGLLGQVAALVEVLNGLLGLVTGLLGGLTGGLVPPAL
jgi:hypothetical protein